VDTTTVINVLGVPKLSEIKTRSSTPDLSLYCKPTMEIPIVGGSQYEAPYPKEKKATECTSTTTFSSFC
jgi:hypothetical protein